MKYGIETEPVAISTFEKNNPTYEIKRLHQMV
jgi:hypothetical protein